MKYFDGHIARSSFGELKDSDKCSICGEKHYSNRLTVDNQKVCEKCFDNDKDKEIVPYRSNN
jgi:formylmethanofuran dehydrogenase subunit E